MSRPSRPWAVVVPVKRLALAKTRLALPSRVRQDLALAMAADTVAACLAAPSVASVVVVTDDERAAEVLDALGATVVADAPDAGLNPALRHGAAVALAAAPASGVAALSADLPALSAPAVGELLALASSERVAVVADVTGTGTTVLAAGGLDAFAPEFGPGSWARHVGAGATDLTAQADPRLRRDVDTVEDLRAAALLGCGPATTALLSTRPEVEAAVAG